MHCDPASATGTPVITRKPATSLRTLPPASEVRFPGVFAWSPITTAAVTAAIGADPGAWNVWRNRRLTPAPMPAAWFRRASGSPLVYKASDVLVWLAARRGEQLDPLTTWRRSLLTGFDQEVTDPDKVRVFAQMYAQAVGPTAGDVRFTLSGFDAYLLSLRSA